MSRFNTVNIVAIMAFVAGGAFAQDAATTAPAAAVTPATAPVEEKRICRSQVETGSLVKKRKVCLTRKQWAYANDTSSDFARRMVEANAGRPTGN